MTADPLSQARAEVASLLRREHRIGEDTPGHADRLDALSQLRSALMISHRIWISLDALAWRLDGSTSQREVIDYVVQVANRLRPSTAATDRRGC